MRKAKFLAALLLVMGTSSFAKELPSKIGSEIRLYKSPTTLGVLYGWRYSHYRSEYFSIGGAGFTGQLSGGASGQFSYGGLVASFNRQWKDYAIELSILGGGGGGTLDLTTSLGGVVLEPNLAISFVLGETVHTSITVGYIWMPNAATFSAITCGLRFEFITEPPGYDKPANKPAPEATAKDAANAGAAR